MREFGWSIEYVLSLSYPVFMSLFGLIRRIRFDSAIDEFFTPYAAAKYGGKCSKHLFAGRGSFLLKNTENDAAGVTEEMTHRAIQRLRRQMDERRKQLEQIAAE